jgi:urate oxidase
MAGIYFTNGVWYHARAQRSAKPRDMKLISHHYGKARVRVLKVVRHGERHDLREADVSVMLEGDFESSYTRGDNSLVVPTDTMKNTVYALTKEHFGDELEGFGRALGGHFLKKYPQVSRVTVRLTGHDWTRMSIDGQPHAHSFTEGGRARPFAEVTSARDHTTIEAGVEDLLILKSTGSGFTGYPKDEFTTLPETRDRILATNMRAVWRFSGEPSSYRAANDTALTAMLKVFATRYSPSVQTTLFDMAQAALAAVPQIDRVRLTMPNKHCLLVNLAPFGLENKNEIFVPTDEPHGQIEAEVARA